MFSHPSVIKSDAGRRRHSSCNNVLEVQRGVLTDRSGSDSSRWRWGRGWGDALDSTRVTWMWTEGGGCRLQNRSFISTLGGGHVNIGWQCSWILKKSTICDTAGGLVGSAWCLICAAEKCECECAGGSIFVSRLYADGLLLLLLLLLLVIIIIISSSSYYYYYY